MIRPEYSRQPPIQLDNGSEFQAQFRWHLVDRGRRV
jgi:hypothetical protein